MVQIWVATSGATITGNRAVFNAWSWIENTVFADALLREKARIAARLCLHMRRDAPGIRELTNVEIENLVVKLYGPGAAAGIQNQYYRAGCTNGAGNWVVDTQSNPTGVTYTNAVRSKTQ